MRCAKLELSEYDEGFDHERKCERKEDVVEEEDVLEACEPDPEAECCVSTKPYRNFTWRYSPVVNLRQYERKGSENTDQLLLKYDLITTCRSAAKAPVEQSVGPRALSSEGLP